jgi:hypothetical protein
MPYLNCKIDKRNYDRYSAKYLSYGSYGFPVDDDASVTPKVRSRPPLSAVGWWAWLGAYH